MVDNLIQQGLQHHQAGRINDAKIIYEQVLISNPRHPDALHLLGLTALQSGDPAKAVELIRLAITAQPKNPAYHANLGAALIEARKPADALAAYLRAGKLNPDEPQFQMAIANCHALCGEHAEAEKKLRKITQKFPRYALAWFNLGNTVRDQGRVEAALEFYRRAIAIDAGQVEAHNNLGAALMTLGRLDEAEQAFRDALAARFRFRDRSLQSRLGADRSRALCRG